MCVFALSVRSMIHFPYFHHTNREGKNDGKKNAGSEKCMEQSNEPKTIRKNNSKNQFLHLPLILLNDIGRYLKTIWSICALERLNAFLYGIRMIWETMGDMQSIATEPYPKSN